MVVKSSNVAPVEDVTSSDVVVVVMVVEVSVVVVVRVVVVVGVVVVVLRASSFISSMCCCSISVQVVTSVRFSAVSQSAKVHVKYDVPMGHRQ